MVLKILLLTFFVEGSCIEFLGQFQCRRQHEPFELLKMIDDHQKRKRVSLNEFIGFIKVSDVMNISGLLRDTKS